MKLKFYEVDGEYIKYYIILNLSKSFILYWRKTIEGNTFIVYILEIYFPVN